MADQRGELRSPGVFQTLQVFLPHAVIEGQGSCFLFSRARLCRQHVHPSEGETAPISLLLQSSVIQLSGSLLSPTQPGMDRPAEKRGGTPA